MSMKTSHFLQYAWLRDLQHIKTFIFNSNSTELDFK